MNSAPEDRAPMVVAARWATRIITVALEMVLPGVFGLWLDSRLGTRFLFAILGFALGMTLGIWHLLRMTGAENPPTRDTKDN